FKFIDERFGLGVASTVKDAAADDTSASSNEEDSNAVVIKFVNDLIKRCIHERATDIHFEPQRESLIIRYRVDGDLIIARVPDNLKDFQLAIVSRLKIMARLNISEKRLPQDGKIMFKCDDELIDIRVSTLPAIYGESVSLRLLNNSFIPKGIENIFLNKKHKNTLKHALASPHGIILVTGPTGSGKSTTLSACLQTIRTPEKRLMTVEDPIEYEISGINQTQINPAIGLTFGHVLRSILRQDPDIIMIGEIRDRETADIAIRASITGHLVLSTLHTNDAVGAITRLCDIGVEKFLLASAMKLVIAQRLVRKLCTYCAIPEDFSKFPRKEAEQIFATKNFGNAHRAVGCEHCNNTGFFGRIGVFEFLEINDDIHAAIVADVPESEIRSTAKRNHMRPLKSDILNNIRLGITSISEAIRVIEH
ncbi:MAG: GspE/PulE family protein, partial [Opitutales bacterium]|nr:GspE/PulE family protein [Opitutales bacterium]